jgi:hypothetical protein
MAVSSRKGRVVDMMKAEQLRWQQTNSGGMWKGGAGQLGFVMLEEEGEILSGSERDNRFPVL